MIEFVPGQRWVSNTESELGLGRVEDCADRQVALSFWGRRYAALPVCERYRHKKL